MLGFKNTVSETYRSETDDALLVYKTQTLESGKLAQICCHTPSPTIDSKQIDETN